jgi:hypothetical protein
MQVGEAEISIVELGGAPGVPGQPGSATGRLIA